tara:strand:+ start:1347 stop:2579 length:1233 start_codon:yes stop_codon:yes gene_type:complete
MSRKLINKIVCVLLVASCDDIGKNYNWNDSKSVGFIRNFGTMGYDYGWSGAYSSFDEGIIITGAQEPIIGGKKNLWAIKTNNIGLVEWDKAFGGNENEEGYDVISTSDGGFLFVGYSWSFGNEQQAYLIKTDYHGNMLWQKNYGGTMWDVGNSVIELKEGGYCIVGFSNSPGISSGNTDIMLVKVDENGNKIWLKAFGNDEFPNHEWGYDIIQINDNGFIIVGSRDRYDSGGKNILIIRTDEQGNKIWEKEIIDNQVSEEIAFSITNAHDGGFYICASSNADSINNYYKPLIMKIDSFGNIDWKRSYDSYSLDYHHFKAITSKNSDIIIVGSSLNNITGNPNADAFVTRIDSNGNIIWSEPYGTLDNDDWGWSIHERPNGHLVVVGSTKSYGSSLFDIFLLGINQDGNNE